MDWSSDVYAVLCRHGMACPDLKRHVETYAMRVTMDIRVRNPLFIKHGLELTQMLCPPKMITTPDGGFMYSHPSIMTIWPCPTAPLYYAKRESPNVYSFTAYENRYTATNISSAISPAHPDPEGQIRRKFTKRVSKPITGKLHTPVPLTRLKEPTECLLDGVCTIVTPFGPSMYGRIFTINEGIHFNVKW